MPITQDRFIAIVDGAARIVNAHEALRQQIMFGLEDDIAEANGAIRAHDLGRCIAAIETLKTRIMTVRDSVLVVNSSLAQLAARILAEQQHFAKVKGRNNRNAFNLRRRRAAETDGYAPVSEPLTEPQHLTAHALGSIENPEEQLEARAAAATRAILDEQQTAGEDFTQTEEYKQFQETMRQRRIATGEIPAHAAEPATEAKRWTVGADGVRRELPSDTDLNAPPKTSEGNLL